MSAPADATLPAADGAALRAAPPPLPLPRRAPRLLPEPGSLACCRGASTGELVPADSCPFIALGSSAVVGFGALGCAVGTEAGAEEAAATGAGVDAAVAAGGGAGSSGPQHKRHSSLSHVPWPASSACCAGCAATLHVT